MNLVQASSSASRSTDGMQFRYKSTARHIPFRAKASLTLAALPALRSLHNAAPARRASNVRHTRLGRDARLNFCTMQRQAKRLRAETGATALSTIAPRQSDSCGHAVASCGNVTRIQRPFLFGVQEPFLFSGKYRKEKWVLKMRRRRLANTQISGDKVIRFSSDTPQSARHFPRED